MKKDLTADHPRQSSANNMEVLTVQTTNGKTTRKTIELPEDYFYQIKMRALERHMKDKELWAEVIAEYFANHPMA